MHLPLCRLLRTDLGSRVLDLSPGAVSSPTPLQGCRHGHFWQLGLQHRSWSLYPPPPPPPPAFASIRWKTYIVFGVFNVAMFIHVLFLFPETAGKTLEETEAMFEDPNGIKYLGIPAWKTRVATKLINRAEHGDIEAKVGHLEEDEKVETAVPAAAAPVAEETTA